MAPRDFVILAHFRVLQEATAGLPVGTAVVVAQSVEDDSCPPIKGGVLVGSPGVSLGALELFSVSAVLI